MLLRRTMAAQMLKTDANIVSIQHLAGHSRITTTQRYSLSNEGARGLLQCPAKNIAVPWHVEKT